MRIDAHQHFWKFDPDKDTWITTEMHRIRKDFLPNHLLPLLDEYQMDGSVAVQVDQSENETHWLVELAGQNEFIKGVVGWVDLKSPTIRDRLFEFSQYKKIKGFRHIAQSEPEGFFRQKAFASGIASLTEFGFTYDVLIYPHQLDETISFVRQFPNQKFVVDHLAKPLIRNGAIQPWKEKISALASSENVWCKVSGMCTEANWSNWAPLQMKTYLDVVFDVFGPKRLLYGSDWPVCLLAASYAQQIAVVDEYISKISSAEKQYVMGENAVQFYNL